MSPLSLHMSNCFYNSGDVVQEEVVLPLPIELNPTSVVSLTTDQPRSDSLPSEDIAGMPLQLIRCLQCGKTDQVVI